MPETYSSVRPNLLSRLRNPLVSAGIGSAALMLATLTPRADADVAATSLMQVSAYETPRYMPLEQSTALKPAEVPLSVKDRTTKVSRSVVRNEPSIQCWDGEISELNHVPKEREKRAMANIAIACEIIADEKWYKLHPTAEIDCLVELWDRESGWDEKALNPSSGAGGIPQALPKLKMKSAGKDWATSAATQISWGTGYIKDRYRSACNALAAHDSKGWY